MRIVLPSELNQLVALTVHGEKVLWRARIGFELAPELQYEVVHGSIRGIGFDSPDVVENLVP